MLTCLPTLFFAQNFPQSWEGIWKGEMKIWQENREVNAFPMSLEISPKDSTWNFIINYQRDEHKLDVRTYSLITINASTGHFAIDEHNSIILDSYLNGNCFYTSFGGLGSELLTRICKNEATLEYEISSVKSAPIRVSGDEIIQV